MPKWIYYSLTFFFASLNFSAMGQSYLGGTYHHGYNVPAYERSPMTNRTSPFVGIIYKVKNQNNGSRLDRFFGDADLNFQLFYQNLGNDEIMGFALGAIPELRFPLKTYRKGSWWGGGGLGLAWINKPFDKVDNPTNEALGTPWNIYAQAAIEYRYEFNEKWLLSAEFNVHHLSNSFFSFPNLGVNIPHLGVSAFYQLDVQSDTDHKNTEWASKTRWRPFARYILGITERAYDGPKFLIQGAGLGIYKKIATHRVVSFGAEFMFDESSYYFVTRSSGDNGEGAKKRARRYLLFAGHEYHFGHFAFATEAGVYLSEQFNRQSIISAKAGFLFFPFDQYEHLKHQLSVGVFIRAYFLRADFFEFNANYRF